MKDVGLGVADVPPHPHQRARVKKPLDLHAGRLDPGLAEPLGRRAAVAFAQIGHGRADPRIARAAHEVVVEIAFACPGVKNVGIARVHR